MRTCERNRNVEVIMRRTTLVMFVLATVAVPIVRTADAGAGAGGKSELPFAITARVREIDRSQAWVLLSDGTHLFALDAKQIEGIREGDTVQVSGEQRNGRKLILQIEPVAR